MSRVAKKKKGGSVLVKKMVQDSFSFKTVECDCQNVIVIYLSKFCVDLVLVYRPPGACFHDNAKLVSFFQIFVVIRR